MPIRDHINCITSRCQGSRGDNTLKVGQSNALFLSHLCTRFYRDNLVSLLLIKALVGGYDFKESPFNRAVQARRQAGSAFKPFIYAAALDKGYTAASLIIDAPIIFPESRRTKEGMEDWTPQNG